MVRTIVGVLRGGTSSEYDLSLKTGAAILAGLNEERYDTRDIFIDKRGIWHLRGMPVSSTRALQQVDIVLNALHGGMGEDGTIQRFLDANGISYAGSNAIGASASLNKIRTHEILADQGVRMPPFIAFSIEDKMTTAQMARAVFSAFGPPYIVKPPHEGASAGIRIAESLPNLPDIIGDVLDSYGAALVEQFIRGDHISVGVIEDFRNEKLYILPPAMQIIPRGSRIIEDSHHRNNTIQQQVPSQMSYEEKQQVAAIARHAHQGLGMGHFSRSDFIRIPPGTNKISPLPSRFYLLEVNAIPGLYEGASFPLMLESVGSSVPEFLEHAVRLARYAR
jgi:D-alanine-D-alanine ligase